MWWAMLPLTCLIYFYFSLWFSLSPKMTWTEGGMNALLSIKGRCVGIIVSLTGSWTLEQVYECGWAPTRRYTVLILLSITIKASVNEKCVSLIFYSRSLYFDWMLVQSGYSWLQNLLVTKLEFFPTFLKIRNSYMTTLLISVWCFQHFPKEKNIHFWSC